MTSSHNELMNFGKELIANGFRVFYNPSSPTFLFAVIDGNIGYVQESLGVGYAYSTVHKPNARTGTGFRHATGGLDIDIMRKCCKANASDWFAGSKVSVTKWKLDKFLAAHPNLAEMN